MTHIDGLERATYPEDTEASNLGPFQTSPHWFLLTGPDLYSLHKTLFVLLYNKTQFVLFTILWPAEGNGNPLQYACLENPMDGGAW